MSDKVGVHKHVPTRLRSFATLVSVPSFLMGYVLASLNSCFVYGSSGSARACYNGDDDGSPNCPPGTIFDTFDMTLCEY